MPAPRRWHAARPPAGGVVDLLPDAFLGGAGLFGLLRLAGRAGGGGRAGPGDAATRQRQQQADERAQMRPMDSKFTAPRPPAQGTRRSWHIVTYAQANPEPPPPRAKTQPSRVRRGYFECRYGQLHVHNSMPPGGGFEEGTPLLCLHDMTGSARVFARCMALAGPGTLGVCARPAGVR